MGHTVTEPIRDEDAPVWDPDEIVTCETCGGLKVVERERADHTLVKRTCPTCRGADQVLRGNPPSDPYEWTLEFTAGGTG